ncbi:MAG: hypothetical protein IT367_20915 [Candidatus Hydrogenedentes bacterium]|nr:hypothetical protein [Candidatus Hydrogenedentota bacterium]
MKGGPVKTHPKLAIVCVALLVTVPMLVLRLQQAEAAARQELGQSASSPSVMRGVLKLLQDPSAPIPHTAQIQPKLLYIDDIISSDVLKGMFPHGHERSEYVYLGYLTEDEGDLAALASYCLDNVVSGGQFADVVPLSGVKPDGRNALLNAKLLKDRPEGSAWSNWYRDSSRVPVFVERSCLDGRGGYVIFLDGSFKYFPYAKGSVWPLTRDGLRSIRAIADPVVDTR